MKKPARLRTHDEPESHTMANHLKPLNDQVLTFFIDDVKNVSVLPLTRSQDPARRFPFCQWLL
jgi:hypothetical protein